MQVEVLPAAPLPGGVKVARRFVKPHGVGASPTLAANFWKAGRYKLAAPVSKTGSALPRSEHYRRLPPLFNHKPKETYEIPHPLPKPIALTPELQTQSGDSHPTHAAAEPRVPAREPVWCEAAINHRLVAQK